MTYILENGNLPIAIEPDYNSDEEIFTSVFSESLAVMPLYDRANLIHTIANGGYDKVWSFRREKPKKGLSDIGISILEVPSWCNAVMFLTVFIMEASAGETYEPFPTLPVGKEELALYAYVPVSLGSTALYPETKIGAVPAVNIAPQPNIRKDIGGGFWEVMCRPVIIPTCGFQYVMPAFHGIACVDANKTKVQAVQVWAVPVNNQHHRPVI